MTDHVRPPRMSSRAYGQIFWFWCPFWLIISITPTETLRCNLNWGQKNLRNWSEKRTIPATHHGAMATYCKPHKLGCLSTIIQSFRCYGPKNNPVYLGCCRQVGREVWPRCDLSRKPISASTLPYFIFDLPTICVTWDVFKPLQTSLPVLCQIPWHVWSVDSQIIFQVVASILFSAPSTRFSI